MSQEQIEQFYQLIKQDTVLQEQLKTIDNLESGLKLVTELAKEKGYIFTSSDLKEWIKAKNSVGSENTEEELSEESLTLFKLDCMGGGDCGCRNDNPPPDKKPQN